MTWKKYSLRKNGIFCTVSFMVESRQKVGYLCRYALLRLLRQVPGVKALLLLWRQVPVKFDVIASNDAEACRVPGVNEAVKNALFLHLLSVENAGFSRPDQSRSWLIPDHENQFAYSFIGFQIHSSLNVVDNVTAVRNALMWQSRT